MDSKKEQIEHTFKLHSVNASQIENMESIRAKAKEFAMLIVELSPACREQSVALTELESSVFWANAAIARSK